MNVESRPRMLMCPICGREYGTKSLPIHFPQCTKKWLEQEELKPTHERRPLPVIPAAFEAAMAGEKPMPMKSREVQDFNNQMNQKFQTESLEHCTICGRSFNEKAFKKHQELCTVHNPFKPVGTGLGAQSLSTKLAPGKISGTKHKQASLPTRLGPEDLISASSKSCAYAFPEAVPVNASATGFARKSGELPIIDTNYSELAPTKAGLSPVKPGAVPSTSQALKAEAILKAAKPLPLELQPEVSSPAPQALAAPSLTLPELPAEVLGLANMVCSEAAGEAATAALVQYLREQRVMKLDWLITALQPKGVSPLLLNKFLSLAKQMAHPKS